MIDHISIDVTDAKQSAVPEEKFKIVKYDFGNGSPFEDLVHNSVPYIHFQVLRPKDKEQREKALAYFKEHGKLYTAFVNSLDILLCFGLDHFNKAHIHTSLIKNWKYLITKKTGCQSYD